MAFPTTVPELMIYAGDTYTQQFIFLDSEGDPIDLNAAGWDDWEAQYRRYRDSHEHVSFTVDATAAVDGEITINLTAEQTLDLHSGVWDLQASDGATVRTFVTSSVYVQRDVTRA